LSFVLSIKVGSAIPILRESFTDLSTAEFQERQEKIAALSEPIRRPHAAHPPTPLLNTDGYLNVAGPAAQVGEPVNARRRKKKKQPKMCHCKEPGSQSGGAGDGGGGGEGGGEGTGEKPFQSEPKVRYPSYPDDQEDAIPTEVCGNCHGHKKPPKGKKIAWRGIFGSWMYVPNSSPEEDPPEEELQHEDAAPRTPRGSPDPPPTHDTLGGIPTPLSEEMPTTKRKRGRPKGSLNKNKRPRPRSQSPTRPPLRRPQHLNEYWSCSLEQWNALSLEGKHHWSHVGRIKETDNGERAARHCRFL